MEDLLHPKRIIPLSILAHSTNVKGAGSYQDGVEQACIRVTLATPILPDECAWLNPGYRDPASINPAEWQGREDEGILYVTKAGEMLHRLKRQPG